MIKSLIDHTQLAANTTESQIKILCEEAKNNEFFSVCINPKFVSYCANQLKGSNVKVCTVIGFPLGANTTRVKIFETNDAIISGADEIDMVVNISDVIDARWDNIQSEITQIKEACDGRLLKVIFETCLLTDEQIIKLCELSNKAGADFVKTSTGFSTGGATVDHIALMRKSSSQSMGVKASGGVRTTAIAQAMVKAGATRIGTSAGIAIVTGKEESSQGY